LPYLFLVVSDYAYAQLPFSFRALSCIHLSFYFHKASALRTS
jgi:hypothetical protein